RLRLARTMSFRLRLTLVAAAAVGIAVVLASIVVYFVARNELRGPIDDSLRARAVDLSHEDLRAIEGPNGARFLVPPRFDPAVAIQVVEADGTTLRAPDTPKLPFDKRVIAVARGESGAFFTDAHAAGTHIRVLTFPFGRGYAVQVVRSLAEVDHALDRLRLFLLLIAGGGIAVAAFAGL